MSSKRCTFCKKEKLTTEFYTHKAAKDGLRHYCKPCTIAKSVKYNSTNLNRYFYTLKHKYGIEKDQYLEMLKNQNNKCAICKSENPGRRRKYLSVDHNHTTKKVRGLLCSPCNEALGKLNGDDGTTLLNRAIYYLQGVTYVG